MKMGEDEENSESIIASLNLKTRSKFSSSFRLGRSRSSVLFSDSIPFESARFTAYERISESMRLSDEPDSTIERLRRKNKKKSGGAWSFMSKVFSFRKYSGEGDGGDREEEEKVEKMKGKLKSSWLPDPNRRWPVQGWG